MRPRLLLPLALLLGALPGCKHDADSAPRCYAGTVVGASCYDGVLINVDAQYPIGKPVGYSTVPNDSTGLANQNAIGALNSNALGALNVKGQRIYFTCRRHAGV